MFSRIQKVILSICGAMIAVCVLILAIDHFLVRPDRPSEKDLIVQVADELGLTLHDPYPHAEELIALTRRVDIPVTPAERIGTVLKREDARHRLWVYEHRYHPGITTEDLLGPRSRDVQLLGILIESSDTDLPPLIRYPNGQFDTNDRGRLEQLMTPDLAQRLTGLDGYTLVSVGRHLLLLSSEPTMPLVAMIERRQSPELADGLANAALKIDVQRAIDIFNRLRPSRTPIAGVRDINQVPVNIQVTPRRLDHSSALEASRRNIERTLAEQREQAEANREKREAERQAMLEQQRLRAEQSRSQRQAELEANRERFRDNLAQSRGRTKQAEGSVETVKTSPELEEQPDDTEP